MVPFEADDDGTNPEVHNPEDIQCEIEDVVQLQEIDESMNETNQVLTQQSQSQNP